MPPNNWPLVGLLLLASGLGGGCASMGPASPLRPVERAFIFQPPSRPTPLAIPHQIEEAWFESADGTRLHGWYAHHPRPKAVVLFCHGNAETVPELAETLVMLHQRQQIALLVFDYRGYGQSGGHPSEKGVLQDARAARAWLASRTGVAESDVVLMGRSLGGGVAVHLASTDGARGLVLLSTFTSLPDVARHHVRWLPARWLMTEQLNSLAKIGRYQGPLLQSHGDSDEIIPLALGQKLHAAAPGPKQFVTVAGAGHNDPPTESFHQALEQFINQLPPGA